MTREDIVSDIERRLEAALDANELVAQATLLMGPGETGAKMLLFPGSEPLGSLGAAALDELVQRDTAEMMAQAKGKLARSISYELPEHSQSARVFIEVFPPPPHLLIFGGVHVAVPLVTFAKTLGYRVTIADPRTTFASRERFPNADEIIAEWPQEAIKQIPITPSTYVVILTHDPKLDEPALKEVLGKGAAYVGAIGSRKTHRERFDRMARHGVSAAALTEVYAPIGLDLNAETPEEIALAIMAEIVAVRRGG
ncbi:MAG: XdhC/CoxI family protein, partial [Chloroflexota bacterium]|nr:XdhC/CoxI family protein [Chloroflexota bacterium]